MKNKRLFAIRGAICCENTKNDIDNAVKNLFDKIYENNFFEIDDIVSIQFTVTPDLDEKNPCTSFRQMCNISSVPLFCCAEPVVKDMLPKVIRVLITSYMAEKGKNIYLNGAEVLRPDLT